MDLQKDQIRYLLSPKELRDKGNTVFLPDANGNMWIGNDAGIFEVNAARDSLAIFTTHEGLAGNKITSLNQHAGKIYAGTQGGLSVIVPPTISTQKIWEINSYGKDQGIRKEASTYMSDGITKNGKFLWGDIGLTILDDEINSTKSIPEVYLTGINIFNEPKSFSNNSWHNTNETDTLWTFDKDTFYLKGQIPVNGIYSGVDNMKWDSVQGPYNMPVDLRLSFDNNYLQFNFAQAHLGSQDKTEYRVYFGRC